jgi:hypothetical protein
MLFTKHRIGIVKCERRKRRRRRLGIILHEEVIREEYGTWFLGL